MPVFIGVCFVKSGSFVFSSQHKHRTPLQILSCARYVADGLRLFYFCLFFMSIINSVVGVTFIRLWLLLMSLSMLRRPRRSSTSNTYFNTNIRFGPCIHVVGLAVVVVVVVVLLVVFVDVIHWSDLIFIISIRWLIHANVHFNVHVYLRIVQAYTHTHTDTHTIYIHSAIYIYIYIYIYTHVFKVKLCGIVPVTLFSLFTYSGANDNSDMVEEHSRWIQPQYSDIRRATINLVQCYVNALLYLKTHPIRRKQKRATKHCWIGSGMMLYILVLTYYIYLVI